MRRLLRVSFAGSVWMKRDNFLIYLSELCWLADSALLTLLFGGFLRFTTQVWRKREMKIQKLGKVLYFHFLISFETQHTQKSVDNFRFPRRFFTFVPVWDKTLLAEPLQVRIVDSIAAELSHIYTHIKHANRRLEIVVGRNFFIARLVG